MAVKVKLSEYIFEVYTYEEVCKRNDAGIYMFAIKLKDPETELNSWGYSFIGAIDNFEKLKTDPLWLEAKNIGGATHIHILPVTAEKHRIFYLANILGLFNANTTPFINRRIASEEMQQRIPSQPHLSPIFNETKSKLELLYEYEKHYLQLIAEYKEEIKFANALQEDLRRERSQFFTQTLKDVVQTMKTAEVDKIVSAQWIQELVASYTKSIDLSSDLAKTHIIEILSILNEEAKQEAATAQLDNLKPTIKPDASKTNIIDESKMIFSQDSFIALQVLKQCRTEMVEDFLNYQPDIYAPSFKYENSPVLLKLAQEKYFMAWLSNHWHRFNEKITVFPEQEQRDIENILVYVFFKLLEKWSILKTTNTNQLNLAIKIIENMQIALHELIKSGDKADSKRNQLELALEKNRVLFDREFKRLTDAE